MRAFRYVAAHALRVRLSRGTIAGLLLCCLVGCLSSRTQPLDVADLKQLQTARIFNLSITTAADEQINLTEADARAFLASLDSASRISPTPIKPDAIVTQVTIQSGRAPITFVVTENQRQLTLHANTSRFRLQDETRLRAWLSEPPE